MFKSINHIFIIIGFCLFSSLNAQDVKEKLSIKDLVQSIEVNYPSIKAKQYQLQASEKQAAIARNKFFPTLDGAVQTNLATHNNISGMSFPQFLLPISGPPSSGNSPNPVLGSAASLLFNWQAVTFGQKNATINEAVAFANVQRAELNHQIFQHKIKVIETYLDWLIGGDLMAVTQKNLQRNMFNLTQSQVLANSGIRPGVDTSLSSGEASRARIELLQMQQYKLRKGIQLEELLNIDTSKILYDSSFLNNRIDNANTVDTMTNPLLALSTSNIAYASAKKESIQRSASPKLQVWGTTFTRGSSVKYNGDIDAVKGLVFSRYNYGIGVQLSVPLLKYRDVRLQKQQQDFIIQANRENLVQTQLEVNKQLQIAESTLQNAIEIAAETPNQLKSAQQSFNALQSRYKAGLIDFADLLQAQYNLSKAEAEVKKSQLEVWKALLYKAAVSGDLNIFLNQVK